jgi:hypothetical protein
MHSSSWCSNARSWARAGFKSRNPKSTIKAYAYFLRISILLIYLKPTYIQVSWCKLEATVSDPKDINPFSETDPEAPKEVPPLTVMSLSVRTIVNHKENKREVVCATARTWHNSEPICFETISSSAEPSFFQYKLMILHLQRGYLAAFIPSSDLSTDFRLTSRYAPSRIVKA